MKTEAYAWIDRALELSPTMAWVWVLAAAVHGTFGDDELAMDDHRRCLELAPTHHISLKALATQDIEQNRWALARERWGQAYPELVYPEPPAVNARNIDAAVAYAINLEQAGLTEEAKRMVERIGEVVAGLPPDSDSAEFYRSYIAMFVDPDPERMIHELRTQIVDNHQRAELDFYEPEYDLVRDRPEFQELVRIVEEDLTRQRKRLRAMERNGEMPPAPGVEFQ